MAKSSKLSKLHGAPSETPSAQTSGRDINLGGVFSRPTHTHEISVSLHHEFIVARPRSQVRQSRPETAELRLGYHGEKAHFKRVDFAAPAAGYIHALLCHRIQAFVSTIGNQCVFDSNSIAARARRPRPDPAPEHYGQEPARGFPEALRRVTISTPHPAAQTILSGSTLARSGQIVGVKQEVFGARQAPATSPPPPAA